MLKHAMIYNLGSHFASFQDRKRDTGIELLSHDTLIGQLHDEELAHKKSQSKAVSLATNTNSKGKRRSQGKLPGIGKDHIPETCPWCKREGKKEDDCWYKNPKKATDDWRKRQKQIQGKNSESTWLTLAGSNASPSFFTYSDRYKTTYDTSSKVNVCNNRAWFTEMYDVSGTLIGTGGPVSVSRKGTIRLPCLLPDGRTCFHTIKDVWYHPDSPINILSAIRMRRGGYTLDWRDGGIKDRDGKEVAAAYEEDGIVLIRIATESHTTLATKPSSTKKVSAEHLHRMMGHMGYSNLKTLIKNTTGLKIDSQHHGTCTCCLKSKLRKRPFGQRQRAEREGEILYLDLVPSIKPEGYNQMRGYISMTDDYTTGTEIGLIRTKEKAPIYVKEMQARRKAQGKQPIAFIFSDRDSVFMSHNFQNWMREEGITHRPTVRDTPQENGLAEVTQFHLHQKATAMLADQNLPKFLWPLAIQYAAYLKYRSPAKRLNGKTPYEIVQGTKPDLTEIRIFGTVVYYRNDQRDQSEKVTPRGIRGRFVGFVDGSNGSIIKVWKEGTRQVTEERNFEVVEDCEPYDRHESEDEDMDFGDEWQPSIGSRVRPDLDPIPAISSQTATRHKVHKPTVEIEQNLPRERELDEPHELSPAQEPHGPSPTPSEGEEDTRHSREHMQNVIHVRMPQTIENDEREVQDTTVSPETEVEEPSIQEPPSSTEPQRQSTRNNRGQPPRRFDDEYGYATSTKPVTAETAASLRNAIALTGAPEEHFYTLYTATLHEINDAHQSFYSYLDDALEHASIVANTGIGEEPGLNDPEPKSFAEAIQRPEGKKWKDAADTEMNQHRENGTFELVELPAGRTALDGKWVFKVKRGAENQITKYKARFVGKGFMQQFGIDYDQTYAGVVRASSVRTIFALTALFDHDIVQLDFVTAYLNSDLDEEIYVKQAPGYIQKGKEHLVYRVKKGLYGLKQSAREWAKRLTSFLIKIGFRPLTADNNVFVKGNIRTGLTITVYVDDVKLIGSDKPAMKQVIDQLSKEFKTTNLGDIKHYLGMEIKRDRSAKTITLSQRAYIEKILDRYGYGKHGRRVKTPMTTGQRLEAFDGIATETSRREFAAQLGSVMYAMITTRPDVAFAVSSLAQHTNNPGPKHWDALKRIFFYLRSTIEYCITFGGESNDKLAGYTDASFAEDSATRRSTGAYIFTLNGGPISWTSKRQLTVALSTTEAEYMAMCQATREAIWLRQLLTELGLHQESVDIYADNKSAIALGKNPEFHKRSKHIDVQYHYVREQVQSGRVTTPYLPTNQMVADGLTKAVSPELHLRFIDHCRLDPDKGIKRA